LLLIPVTVYIVALIILFFENKYTWAPSIIEKPVDYEHVKVFWMLIPKLMKWISSIWFFFALKGLPRIMLPIGLVAFYSFLNRYFTKHAILRSVEAMYPSFLEGILEAYKQNSKKEVLSESELQEKVNLAKFLTLQKIWREATGKDPNAEVMSALIKRLKYPADFLKYMY